MKKMYSRNQIGSDSEKLTPNSNSELTNKLNNVHEFTDLPVLKKTIDQKTSIRASISEQLVDQSPVDSSIPAVSTPSLFQDPNSFPVNIIEPDQIPPVKEDTFWDDDDDLVNWATSLPF